MSGDCFPVAGRMMLKSPLSAGLTLVHGTPIGTGSENAGQRYWHAWIETQDGMVIDRSNGKVNRPPIERDVYYQLGHLKEEHIWRYTSFEAYDLMTVTQNFGPWVDDYEGTAL